MALSYYAYLGAAMRAEHHPRANTFCPGVKVVLCCCGFVCLLCAIHICIAHTHANEYITIMASCTMTRLHRGKV
jgi:hypothetical protein